MYYYSTIRSIYSFTVPRRVEGWVDLGIAVSVQPVPKAAYRSDFRANTNFCPQRDSNLGPLAQQASMLPLEHCDLLSVICWRRTYTVKKWNKSLHRKEERNKVALWNARNAEQVTVFDRIIPFSTASSHRNSHHTAFASLEAALTYFLNLSDYDLNQLSWFDFYLNERMYQSVNQSINQSRIFRMA